MQTPYIDHRYIVNCTCTEVSSLSASRLRFCWIGRMKILPPPTTPFSSFGDWATVAEIGSKAFVLGIHLSRSNPPHPSSFGNTDTKMPLYSSQVQLAMSGMQTFFSPKPASARASLSATEQGTQLASLELRHTIFIVQLCPLLPLADLLVRL